MRAAEVGEGILVRHTRRSMVLDGTVRAAHVRDHYRRRYLRYALCATHWTYRRLGCPACGNTEEARLERLLAEDDPGWRLDLCAHCRRYLSAADLARIPDPELYALAAWGLEGVARRRGYNPVCEFG
ncbi:MAG: formate dehydrogenase accessory protein FdhE [Thermaerobacter sp.]|nr:formate dehydrogenase accessory protein FdhE [Thermaerobacter sp.]